ncbi:MAG: flagellar basal body-associated protein FliL [Hydrogenimonas sp.]|nr:flagellar basal body-associated protein FliL [Hydrogenimonas sp.]
MAEEEKEESQESGGENEKKRGGGGNIVLIIVIVLLLLVLVIGGIVAYLMLSEDNEGDAPQVTQEKVEKKRHRRSSEQMGVGPMYPLDKFTVNLMSENGRRYLVAKINLEEDSEELTPELDKKTALIRDVIISILSSKTVEEITTAKGKAKLKDEIINQINKHLEDGEVRHIYFTEFVIQ